MIFGNKIPKNKRSVPERSVIADPETAPIGNIILRVGRENTAEGTDWHQTEHVALTPPEAVEFANSILDLVAGRIPQVRREKFAKDARIALIALGNGAIDQPLDTIE